MSDREQWRGQMQDALALCRETLEAIDSIGATFGELGSPEEAEGFLSIMLRERSFPWTDGTERGFLSLVILGQSLGAALRAVGAPDIVDSISSNAPSDEEIEGSPVADLIDKAMPQIKKERLRNKRLEELLQRANAILVKL